VPNLAMIVVTGLTLLLVVKSLRQVDDSPWGRMKVFSRGEMIALLKIGAVFAVSLAAFLLGAPLVAGIVLVAGTLLLLGERRPLILVLMPAGLLLAIWALFYKLLGSPIV
jgi:hypothetical protein